jgi:hypothetical protein
MKDIVNSFKAHLYDRTSSPLLGAFIFYWLIFNFKIIVILFDDKLKSSEKFIELDILYKNDLFYNIPINGLLFPVIITLIYLLIFPLISNLIHKAWLYHQDNLKKISNKQLHTDKEYGELREEFTSLQLSVNDSFKSKNIELQELRSLLNKKDKTIANNEKSILEYKERENKKIEEYKDDFSTELNQIYEKERTQYIHYSSLIEPNNSVLKTLSIDEKIILLTIYNHKDKKLWNVLTASMHTTNEAGKKLLEKGLIENIEPEHYKLSKEGEKIFK